jgi:thiol-disulfide isomerase/thioredoxin
MSVAPGGWWGNRQPAAESALQATPQATPAPQAILQAVVEACRRIKTVEYLSAQETLAPSIQMFSDVRMQMRRERASVPPVFIQGKFHASGKSARAGQEKEFAYAYDGRVFRYLDKAANQVRVMAAPTPQGVGMLLAKDGLGIYSFPEFTDPEPLKELMEGPGEWVYAGRAEVDGVACHTLTKTITRRFETGRGSMETTSKTTAYFGEKDHLPRRYVNELTTPQRTIKTQTTAYNLRVNQPFDETAFRLEPSADYTESIGAEEEVVGRGLLFAGSTAPPWKLVDAAGKEHELAQYRGKIVVLDFWATWRRPCLKAMPDIQKLHERYRDRGAVVLGLATNDDHQLAAEYMRKKGYSYPLLLNGEKLREYNPTALPTLYLIGPDGKVLLAEVGNRRDGYEKYASLIERHLKNR